ncbi:hypothetical protein AAA799P11_00604 [Marine Group I thaumarchaeote SCGC AAA799-P11]|uniref:Uncharacterized protein n=1 Tax=Marine Group I thaumarchaeote SCGC AAA799-P11 TaxID=1502295 RepID=A0A087S1L1_9ARCH|nr:hypothetical protein AAA799P11_00604 [Marine Group I thaumarchaeote SCGC AAA799-P11]
MSDSELIGGGIVGGLIGYQKGFETGHKQGYVKGRNETIWEYERQITALQHELAESKQRQKRL